MTLHAEPSASVDLSDALHALWDLSVDMLVIADTKGYFTKVSPAWSSTLGYDLEELVSQPYLDFVHPDDVEGTLTEAQALTEPGAARFDFENRFRAKDGSFRWLAWDCRTSDDGAAIYGVVRDVTQQHESAAAHQQLIERFEERELMLSSVIENNLSLIYVKDLEGRYLIYNQRFAGAFDLGARGAAEGLSAEKVLLGRDDTWLDPAMAPTWRANDLRAARKSHSVEEWSQHPTRGRLSYDSLKFPLLDASGKVYATCGVSLETTERVRLIEQHRQAEELFRGAFEHSPIGKALVDAQGRLMRANPALARIIGHDVDALVGRGLGEVLSPAYAEQVTAMESSTEVEVVRSEFEIQNAAGEGVWVWASSSTVRDPAGRLLYYVSQVQDVTSRVRAHEAQRKSEAHFRALFTHASVGVIEALPDGTIVTANPHICTLLGYRPKELVGQPTAFLTDPSHRMSQAAQIAALSDGADAYATQRQFRCKDGRVVPVLVNVGVVRTDAGEVERLVKTIVDMTAQVDAEKALRFALAATAARQSFMEAVLESVDTGVLACDADGRVLVRNGAHAVLFGIKPTEDLSRDELRERVRLFGEDGQEVSLLDSSLTEALQGVDRVGVLMRIPQSGRVAPAEVRVTTRQIRDDSGALLGAVAAFTDVSAERETQAQLREGAAFHDAVLAATPDLIYVSDPRSGANVWASRSVLDMLGYTDVEVRELDEQFLETLIHPDDVQRVLDINRAVQQLADGDVLELRYRLRHVSGSHRWLARRLTPFARDADGAVTRVLGVARDISEIVDVEHRLSEAALHDPLTGLPNRSLLGDRLRSALSRSRRTGEEIAVLFCDLDGFKHVNDRAGHHAGDEVLRTTAQRLVRALRTEDTVARVGGDEFAILLEPSRQVRSGHGPVDVRAHAEEAAARLREAVRVPIEAGHGTHVVSASIGIRFGGAGADPDDILRDADTAMYRAKSRGRDRAEIFDGALRADAIERGRIEGVLRATIAALPEPGSVSIRTATSSQAQRGGRLHVAYQPIVDLATMEFTGMEALARLDDEHGRPIPPDAFIPVAEETGLIGALGRHVLDVACDDLAGWHRNHPRRRGLGVAVNLSARQAGLVDLRENVRTALARTGLRSHLLTLELTESVLLDAGRSTMTALTELSELGVGIAIDDFGTGYASLRYLAQLPVSSVKVDYSFTSKILEDPTSASIVHAIIGLARDLKLGCVVEGIETAAQLAALPTDVHGQGFLLGRPVPAEEIDVLLTAPVAC